MPALAVYDEDGAGPWLPRLFAGIGVGEFGGVMAWLVARWDGWEASPVGGLIWPPGPGVYAFLPLDEPQGMVPAGLYALGDFEEIDGVKSNRIARWSQGQWHEVAGGLTSPLYVAGFGSAIFDEDGDGPLPTALFVGGQFQFAGGVPANALARWDGQAWSQVGGGLSEGDPDSHPTVDALAVYDDGRGPALYVGGSFRYAGGETAYNIARWDGQNWEPVGGPGGGLNTTVETLCVFDEDWDGPKAPVLFAGGQFNKAIGNPTKLYGIARWDGQAWSDVGGWLSDGSVQTMGVFKAPDDDRDNLYIGGYFNILPDLTVIKGIARWDGQTWRELDFGVSGYGGGTHVKSLAAFDEDGDGPNPGGLYVGGVFYYAGDVETHHVARWGCPLAPPCYPDLDHSGTLDLFDFLAFVNLFNASDPAADCDASGSLDLFDFLCFTNAFNAGC